MRLWLKIAVVSLLFVSPVVAQNFGSSYDWRTGNMYHWNGDSQGTNLNGFNPQTGSMWSGRYSNDGTSHGMDSRGNAWNYNSNTKTYMNSDGHGCVGTGYARSCW
jgi:hypothetical protein